jgi:hypothetical protein
VTERGAIDVIEEAMLLFRNAGLATAGLYYIGSLPFVLAFLFFWADMSSDAFAYQSVIPASLGLALLFLWMNIWQSIYAAELRRQLTGAPQSRWTARRIFRTAILQSAVQPSSLLLIPAGVLLILPFAWIYGFYQNFTAMAGGEEFDPRALVAQSRAYALLWTRQSWLILAIQAGFTIIVAANIAITMFFLPRLLQMFLGIETPFAEGGTSMLNSTFFAVTAGLTYLCVDPIMKAIYLLRCFYAESVRSGADLKVEFRRSVAGVVLLLLALLLTVSRVVAQTKISAPEVNRAIERVIHERQYAWRLPRQPAPESDSRKSLIVRFTKSAMKMANGWLKQLGRGFSAFLKWFNDWLRRKGASPNPDALGQRPAEVLRMWMCGLLAIMAAALVILLLRNFRKRRPAEAIATSVEAVPIDLTLEDVSAAQLPEDGWRVMAREFVSKGDFRMALRALYLASLAYLGERELILIHRSKSNLDYQRELDRRARGIPELTAVFRQNVAVVESSWYGRREIGPEAVDAFLASLDRMKACAE